MYFFRKSIPAFTGTKGVEGIVPLFPALTINECLAFACEFSYSTLLRNLVGAQECFPNYIRHWLASSSSLNILEMSSGVPRAALEMLDPVYCRGHGDHWIYSYGRHHDSPSEVRMTHLAPACLVSCACDEGDYRYEMSRLLMKRPAMPAETIKKVYAAKVECQEITVLDGKPLLELLELAVSRGYQYDLIISHILAWIPERLHALELIYRLLKSKGRAYLSLNWWSPKYEGGLTEFVHLKDSIEKKTGELLPLEEYLVAKYPSVFSIGEFPGAKTLIVHGSSEKIKLFAESVRVGERVVRNNFPNLIWTIS